MAARGIEMVDFGKLNAAVKKMETILPALTEKLNSMGGCAPRHEIEKLYGRQIISLAVDKKHVQSVTIIRKDPTGARPSTRHSVICNGNWKRDTKPSWLE